MRDTLDSRFAVYAKSEDIVRWKAKAALDPELSSVPKGRRFSEFIRKAADHYVDFLENRAEIVGAPEVTDFPGVAQAAREALEEMQEGDASRVTTSAIKAWIIERYGREVVGQSSVSIISRLLTSMTDHGELVLVEGDDIGGRGKAKVYSFAA